MLRPRSAAVTALLRRLVNRRCRAISRLADAVHDKRAEEFGNGDRARISRFGEHDFDCHGRPNISELHFSAQCSWAGVFVGFVVADRAVMPVFDNWDETLRYSWRGEPAAYAFSLVASQGVVEAARAH